MSPAIRKPRRRWMRSAAVAALASTALLPLSSCDSDGGACANTGRTATMVTSSLGFVMAKDDHTSVGFDVDSTVSDGHDAQSCYIIDRTSPDGEPGIDNNISALLQLVLTLTGDAIDGLVKAAINDGTLLLMFRLEGVDDLQNDPCVNVTLLKGLGKPQLATTGSIAPSQTFDVDPGTAPSHVVGRIVDGVFEAGPFEAQIPLRFFQVSVNMRMHQVHIRANVTADGGLTGGLMGGGVELEQIYDVARQSGLDALAGAAPIVAQPLADLDLDPETGDCRQISATLSFEAQHAFLLGDSP